MKIELVHDGFHNVSVPNSLGSPRKDQMQGMWSEQLVEVAGRTCYDSMGTGRTSGDYHKNLILEQKHYSVVEHVHFTLDSSDWDFDMMNMLWGLKDAYLTENHRLTLNLRHAFEWPLNQVNMAGIWPHKELVLRSIFDKVIGDHLPCLDWLKQNEIDVHYLDACGPDEWFVTLFLEDSIAWSLEQNRHRGNISQRSGRFCDQTDRSMCMHPLLTEYLADGQHTSLEIAIRRLEDDSRVLYAEIVNQMQPWLQVTKGLDTRAARKQARSAARYYLGQGLSTEACYTYNLRLWKHVFKMRISPHADAAINNLMIEARDLIAGIRPEYAKFLES